VKVTCAIIFSSGKILVTQRPNNKRNASKWEFPGGKVNEYESEVQSIEREILEELNLQITAEKRLIPVSHGDFQIELIPYICKIKSGQLQLNEHQNFVWASMEELKHFQLCEADIPILDQIKNLI
jgi:8-oxo-dGTP diphosphatase